MRPMGLGQSDINDLRWYFERSETEISGIHSPALAFDDPETRAALRAFKSELRCGRIYVGGGNSGHHDTEVEDRRLDAVFRERRVRRRLENLTASQRDTLFRCFALDVREQREIFGQYGNLADFTRTAAEAHRAARTPRLLSAWLDHLARRVRNHSATPEGDRAHLLIMLECRDRAREVANLYERGKTLAAA